MCYSIGSIKTKAISITSPGSQAYLQLVDDREARKALTRDKPEDTNFIMSDEELDELLGRLWRTRYL